MSDGLGGSGGNATGDTPLHLAASHNDPQLVTLLLRKGANHLQRNKDGDTPVDIATKKQFTDVLKVFKEASNEFYAWCETKPNTADEHGYTKLMKAVQRNDLRSVSMLLDKNVDVNAVGKDGLTALMVAAFEGHRDIAQLLVEAGANPSLFAKGQSALDLAQMNKRSELIKYLTPLTTAPKRLKGAAGGRSSKEPPLRQSVFKTIKGTTRGSVRRSQLVGERNGVANLFARNSRDSKLLASDDVVDSIDAQVSDLQDMITFAERSSEKPAPTSDVADKVFDEPRSTAEADEAAVNSEMSPMFRSSKSTLPHLRKITEEETTREHERSQAADELAVKISQTDITQLSSILSPFSPFAQPQQPQGDTGRNHSPMKSRAVMLLDAAHQQQLPPPPPTSPPNIPPPSVGRDEQSTTAPVTPVNANANDGATEVIDNIMFEMESFLVEQQQTEHMTTITVIFISVVQEIVSLITAVTNRFNRQFIDITATAVHSIGEITREIREAIRKKEDPKDAKDKKSMAVLKLTSSNQVYQKILDQMKEIDPELQDMARKVKIASGVWPPPNALLEMVEAAHALCMSVHKLVAAANDANLFDIIEDDSKQASVPSDHPQPSRLFTEPSSPTADQPPLASGLKRFDYREYQRQQNLKLIADISTASQQGSVVAPIAPVQDDVSNAFLDQLDAVTKVFVEAMKGLRDMMDADQKDSYLEKAQLVANEALNVAKQAEDKINKIKITDSNAENVETVRKLILQKVFEIPLKNADLLSKTALTLGVWPPPTAKQDMNQAVVAVARSLKDLVQAVKTAILEFSELWQHEREAELKERAEWEAKLSSQNVKIKKMEQLIANERAELDQEEINLSEAEQKLLEDPADLVDVVYEEPPGSKIVIKGGTLEKLVIRLTYFKYHDGDFRKAFLLTYQSFTTPAQLLELIIGRYEAMPPMGLSEQQFQIYLEKKIIPTRLRVYNVLRSWISDHFEDWAENTDLIKNFGEFAERRLAADMPREREKIMKLLRDKLDGLKRQSILTASKETPPPILPKSVKNNAQMEEFLRNEGQKNWIKIDPLEIARQLTKIEFSMYEKIQSKECLNQGWNGKKKYQRSPNISNVIDFTNQLSAWVATKILEPDQVRQRLKVLSYFVELAQRLRDLNNFNTCTSIMAALESSPVHRLKKVWEAFYDRRNHVLIGYYEDLLQLINAKGNYASYRRVLHAINPPVVPFLGVYLTDLTFIEDGNSDALSDKRLINFDKRRKLSKSIEEIKMYQQAAYSFTDVVPIQNFLCAVRGLDERLLYKRSLEVEPREESTSDPPPS